MTSDSHPNFASEHSERSEFRRPEDHAVHQADDGGISLTRADEIKLQKLLANYRLTPMTLAMKINPKIIPAPHLMYISIKVANAIKRGNGRIIISLPPRHGKSELITKNTPIWTLENFGQKNVILCSYGAELSTDFGRKVRDMIKDNKDILNLRIRQDAERVNNWLTNQGGAMMSVGLGGPITGRGADVLVIDDYIKEIKESLSQSHRDYIWDWFVTTAYTRLEPGGTCIIVATRWHHDDLIGRILKHMPGEWENIVIPAFAEPEGYIKDDPTTHDVRDFLGRQWGEPLFPERFGEKDLRDRKTVLGSFFFNALYQQRPENDMGQLTNRDWLKYIPHLPTVNVNDWQWIRVWDLAATEDGGDYLVGSLIGHNKKLDQTILADVKRGQFSPQGVERLLVETASFDGPHVTIGIEQEPGSSGKLLVHNYAAKDELRGFKVVPIPTSNKKVLRAQPFLSAVEAGKVWLLTAPWNSTFADEYDDFPAGDHDDQIDTCGGGYTYLTGKKPVRVSWGRDASNSRPQYETDERGEDLDDGMDEIILQNGLRIKADLKNTSAVAASNSIFQMVPRKAGVVWGR